MPRMPGGSERDKNPVGGKAPMTISSLRHFFSKAKSKPIVEDGPIRIGNLNYFGAQPYVALVSVERLSTEEKEVSRLPGLDYAVVIKIPRDRVNAVAMARKALNKPGGRSD